MKSRELASFPTQGSPVRLVKATDLTKRFGGVHALEQASFEAAAGEVHGLLGENGAGKSTLIRILAGVQSADSGTVEIAGTPVPHTTPRAMRRLGVTAVFQELSLVPDFDVARNVWLENEPRTALWTLSKAQARRQTEALFDELEFPALPFDVPVRELPVAARQLVEIAKAMSKRPSTLILDEPTSALAPAEVALVVRLMRRHTDSGGLCIFISHRLAEVREVADRVTVLRNGRDVCVINPSDEDDDTIISHIIGRRIEQLFPQRRPPRERVLVRATNISCPATLHDVDFEIREGEILGVGGLAGQGQRELFLRLYGVMKGSGDIEIEGRKVSVRSPRDALAHGCALIPEDRQNEGLLLSKSVRENLCLTKLQEVSRYGVISGSRERTMSARLIASLQIAVKRDRDPVDSLSGGNQQKVVIGKFLTSTTKVLLCFDPTRGVDVGARHAIFDLMHQLAGEGKAVLFFSTDNSELIHVAHRVLVLAGGRRSALLDGDDVNETALVTAALGGTTQREHP